MKEPTEKLQSELQEILDWFEGEEFSIDSASDRYERGHAIIQELTARLTSTENKIKKLNINLEQ